MAKLIVLEGTDGSGKETQSKLLVDKLNSVGIKSTIISFPMYDSPTGKIIGACYLGKEEMCEDLLKDNKSFFKEGAPNVDPITSSLLYAADRRVIILNRYIYSNMAHQAGKIENKSERTYMFQMLDNLEFNVCRLPRPDKIIFLHVPYETALELRKKRKEKLDSNERSIEHLKNAEETYLLLADYYGFDTINCINDNNKMRNAEDIHKDIYNIVKEIVE